MPNEQANPPVGNSVSDDKVFAVMSYLWALCLIPLLMKRGNTFIQSHAKQGFLLFLFEVVIWVLMFIPPLYFIGVLVAFVFSIMGILNALQGKEWEMPVLGVYAKKLNF